MGQYNMRRLIFIILTFCLTAGISRALTLTDEDLNYKIMYKWGLVNTQAGRATLSLRNNGNNYHATLIARSEPWADRIYKVRDTLLSDMTHDIIPLRYEKIAHEDGKYTNDIIEYTLSNNEYTGSCTRHRQKGDDKPVTTEQLTLQATGQTVDMLSVFYYLRTLDFPNMKTGESNTINIFSGKKKELLRIKYNGFKSVKVDGKIYYTYHVSFRFTTDDGKKSSDDIESWISADANRIPIKLEGSLPIGKIRCLYIENKK